MNKKQIARHNKLQSLCRKYLSKVKYIATKYGLKTFVKDLIKANKRGECKANEREVEMLARLVNDDRIARQDIPKILGKTYRECNDNDLFDNIARVDNRSSYSRISTELYACELASKDKQHG